jgi:hypothetical protein
VLSLGLVAILNTVRWGVYGDESVAQGVLDATYNGTNLPVYSHQIPPEFTTRDTGCTLWFYVTSGAISGWIEFDVNVYLRNE